MRGRGGRGSGLMLSHFEQYSRSKGFRSRDHPPAEGLEGRREERKTGRIDRKTGRETSLSSTPSQVHLRRVEMR